VSEIWLALGSLGPVQNNRANQHIHREWERETNEISR